MILGERKGQGVKSGMRCLWDCEVDGYTSEIFMNVGNKKYFDCVWIEIYF